jgi:thioredoxin-like negative regulator of GroEL
VSQVQRAPTGAVGSERPLLVVFTSATCGRSRRIEPFLAQILQRRRNHSTFKLVRVDADRHPDQLERFGVRRVPALLVVANGRVRARLDDPRTCSEISSFLAPWLR